MNTRKIRIKVRKNFLSFPSLIAACRHFKIPSTPVRKRISRGWKVREAILTPLRAYKNPPYKPSKLVIDFKASRTKPISMVLH